MDQKKQAIKAQEAAYKRLHNAVELFVSVLPYRVDSKIVSTSADIAAAREYLSEVVKWYHEFNAYTNIVRNV